MLCDWLRLRLVTTPMRDADCVAFLQWCLPRLALRWPGFRKVRKQVCKRLRRRLDELGLDGLDAYRARLQDHPQEWERLDGMCLVTISRFWRDRSVFDAIGDTVLPRLARSSAARRRPVRCWSAGCASGEEVYSLRILWDLGVAPDFPAASLSIFGTDLHDAVLARAEAGCYAAGALKELPPDWRERAFERRGDAYCVRPAHRVGIRFRKQDIRDDMPDGPFELILCRNLAFTYFQPELQSRLLDRLVARLASGGYLIIGRHEALPPGRAGLVPCPASPQIMRKHRTAGRLPAVAQPDRTWM